MTPYFLQAGVFLVEAAFGFYLLAVLLRFLFQLLRADFYNPVAQFLVALTNPPLLPLRRAIPGLFGIDLASVVLLAVLKLTELYLIGWIRDFTPAFAGVALVGSAQLLRLTIYVYIVAILARVILSWVNPYGSHSNPAMGLLWSLTEPLLRRARRLIPAIGGLDLSPIGVFIALELTLILVVQPLHDLGYLWMLAR
ncbi:MAG: YggT family protein [Gammaproteobacteria bacterium]|nr:YggT family protein [Gammaproteobacteria bacterium]